MCVLLHIRMCVYICSLLPGNQILISRGGAMDPEGNRLQNSCSPRHWGHSTMHRVPSVSGTTTTMCGCVCVYSY